MPVNLRQILGSALALALASCTPFAPIRESNAPLAAQNPPDGMPLALAWARGTEVTMGLDTGAGAAVMLFAETARALGGRVRGAGAVRSTNVEVSLLPGGPPLPGESYVITLGDAPLANCEGLLGWPALRAFVWNLDLPEGNHLFAYKTPFAARGWRWLPIDREANVLTVQMPGVGAVLLDTGSPLAVCLSPRKWAEFKKQYPHVKPTVYWGHSPAAGGYYARECAYLASFRLGPWEMKNVLVGENFVTEDAWGAPVPDYVMGMGALERRSVWIDGPAGKLYYSSPHGEIPRLLGLNQVGVTFIPRHGHYTAFVAEGSPAQQSGVKTGDVLVTIDGRRPEGMLAIDQATTQPGASVELCLRRQGRLNLVNWTLGESLAPVSLDPPVGSENLPAGDGSRSRQPEELSPPTLQTTGDALRQASDHQPEQRAAALPPASLNPSFPRSEASGDLHSSQL